MALNFLEAWRAEIPWRRPAEPSSGASGAAAQLQQEAEDLIETWENLDLGNGKHLYIYTHNFGIFLDMNPRFGVEHGDKPLFFGELYAAFKHPQMDDFSKGSGSLIVHRVCNNAH